MLALLYLILAIYVGDQLSRRAFRYLSVAQRCATAVLIGLPVSSCFTYAVAWCFRRAKSPLLWADLCFFAVVLAGIWLIRRRPPKRAAFIRPSLPGSASWDWAVLGGFLVMACWMMFATLGYRSSTGTLLIGNNEWSDFGPHTAIIQSFAVGHNFPTDYPHFAGEPIRYHFLFYFQAGNLTFLGLNLAWSLNLLSIITLVAMLALVMALGQALFHSRVVGRLGAAFFFFHGTLSFVAFLRSQPSFKAALHSIVTLKDFLPSGYPYRGELWGIWTQVVYLNQRHFASGLGILLIVLLFLFDRYRQHYAAKAAAAAAAQPVEGSEVDPPYPPASWEERPPVEAPPPKISFSTRVQRLASRLIVFDESFLFAGCLLGLLPFWNALIFTAAFAILAGFFLLFPCRRQLVALGVATAVVALPQLVLIQSGGSPTATHSFFHWGYVIDQPTWGKIIRYVGFSFGLKLGLAAVALFFASWFQIRFFITLCVLWVITFSLQLSVEGLANHKFLNVWLIISNLFVAYALWRLWRLSKGWLRMFSQPAAALAAGAIFLGGAIDLFPIHNSYWIDMKFGGDALVKWVQENTRPHDVFLSDRFVNHQILLAGRRIFYGWPSFAWSSGYDTTTRDREYREFFESNDPYAVFRLLHKHKIAYVAIDDAVRHSDFIKQTNEKLYALNCPKVWEDKNREYNALVIYKVPDPAPKVLRRPEPSAQLVNGPAVTMFHGGKGVGRGQFDFPRGMTADATGNFFVADTNNGRIEKFLSNGAFVVSLGTEGRGPGQFGEPNAVAVDAMGNLYVTEAGNHRVQKLSSNGTSMAEWKGPTPGFYGPRKITLGPDNSLYVVDQGRTRVVRFGYDGQVLTTWGSKGNGEGQFDDPTSVAVDPARNRVYVADPRNKRIQVFDNAGKFLNQWPVSEWGAPNGYEDIAVDGKDGRVYASSAHTSAVLVFDPDGARTGSVAPNPSDKLEAATALVLLNEKLYVLCAGSNRVVQINLPQ